MDKDLERAQCLSKLIEDSLSIEVMKIELELEQNRQLFMGYFYEPYLVEMYLMHGNGD